MSARVKKLEWKCALPQTYQANTPLGVYVADTAARELGFVAYGPRMTLEIHKTIGDAKSACQSHYEKAVMALLGDDK